jgi:hypothetical protein
VKRGAFAGVFALALAAGGLSAAAVASGAGPLSLLATTTGTTSTGTTTTAPAVIAAGVRIGGVPVGGMTADDAYLAVGDSFSRPLAIVVRNHRLAPDPSQIGASARVGEAVALAGNAAPGARIPLDVTVNSARVRAYVAQVAKRFDQKPVDAQLFLRNLRPWIAKPVAGLTLYRGRAQAAIESTLLANTRGPLRLATPCELAGSGRLFARRAGLPRRVARAGRTASATRAAVAARALLLGSLSNATHQVVRQLGCPILRLVEGAFRMSTDRVARHQGIQPGTRRRKQQPLRADAATSACALALRRIDHILEPPRHVDHALGDLVCVCHCLLP